MKPSFLRGVFLVILGVVSLAVVAPADTLEMKDGRLIQGRYMGGSEHHIRFQVSGQEQMFDVKDVLNLGFNDSVSASSNSSEGSSRGASYNEVAASAPREGETVTIPAGTEIMVRMVDTVDSSKNKIGDQFQASLEDPLVVGDTVVAPKGADVYGRLEEVKAAGHIAGKSDLKLALTGIRINGNIQPVFTGDYDVSGKSRGKQTAKRAGGGAAVGAVIGAIAGGGKGAAIGAGVGAGAGTAVQVVTHGEQVKVPSETLLTFRLEQPMNVTVSHRDRERE
jgi:hypothetical protein